MIEVVSLDAVRRIVNAGTREIAVLNEISLTVGEGEFVALTGPSGSGKSTLLHLIGLLDRPTTGRISLFGQSTLDLSAREAALRRATSIGFVFQSFHLIRQLTVRENIALPLRYAGRTVQVDKVDQLLKRFCLTGLSDAFPHTLSGGEKQRVAVARALVNDPALVLADEPTGSLDSENSANVIGLLNEIHREGRTVIIVTHDPSIARQASRVIALRDGRLEAAA